ncbi:MAG: hypothetical protein EPN58_05940 [Rhodanobacter sp.]|nr:MAG: hypothetical protein EPN58_05940 [Rhodanobacter sp.]
MIPEAIDVASIPRVSLAQATRVWAKIGWLSFSGLAGQIAVMHLDPGGHPAMEQAEPCGPAAGRRRPDRHAALPHRHGVDARHLRRPRCCDSIPMS